MNKTRVLITGATGLLGTHLLLKAQKSCDVYATVHEYKKVLDLNNVTYTILDIRDRLQVIDVFSKIKPDIVFHTAAHGRLDYCEQHKDDAYSTNFLGTKYIVDELKKYNGKIIFCSTNATYDGLNPPYDEKSIQKPDSYYAQTKVDSEKYIMDSGIDYTIVRLMTMYGWNFQPTRKNMVSMVIEKLKNNEHLWMTNDVFNNMLFVEEAANFFWKILKNKDISSKTKYNIAGYDSLNRYETVMKICEVFDFDKSLVTEVDSSYFSGEVPRSPDTTFNTEKARKELQYKPIKLKTGIQRMKSRPLSKKVKYVK